MKHTLPLTLLVLASALPLNALGFDYGLITDTQTTLNLSDTWAASQRNTQRLWGQYDSAGVNIRLQARLTTSLALPEASFTLDPDLETLKFQWSVKQLEGLLNETDIQAGRFSFRDPAQFVLSSTLDGFMITLGAPVWQTRLGFGYNGLLSKSSSSLALTQSDITDQSNEKVFFAAPRAVGLAEASLLWGHGQKISFTYLPQLDLRKMFPSDGRVLVEAGMTEENKVEGGILNTHHGVLTFSGQFVSGFYYTLSGAVLAGTTLYYKDSYKEILNLGTAGTLGLDWFLKDSLNSALHLQGWYTSGDGKQRKEFGEGSTFTENPTQLSLFKTLSNTANGFVFAPQWGNLISGELSYSFKLFNSARSQDGLTTSLSARTFFRPQVGPISSTRVYADKGGNYLGTESVVSLRYRPLSDLSLSFTAGFFLPGTGDAGGFIQDESSVETKAALYLSLSL